MFKHYQKKLSLVCDNMQDIEIKKTSTTQTGVKCNDSCKFSCLT